MSNSEYVQYGCGWSAPLSWLNFDASPTLRFERLPVIGSLYTKNKARFPCNVKFGNIITGLPIDDESCKAIYCSHVLEHLSLEDFRKALRNTYIKLKPGGIFRCVVPDLEYYARKYTADTSVDAAITFMRETSLGQEKRSHGLRGFIISWLGNSQHLWMWDYKSMESELIDVGFKEVRRAQYGDSTEAIFKEVEDKARWDNCLGIECVK